MAEEPELDGRRGVHVTAAQARRARVPGGDGGAGLDAVVVELGTEAGELPPLVVPVEAVPGLVAVLLEAAGLAPTEWRAAGRSPLGAEAAGPEGEAWPVAEVPVDDGSTWSQLVGAERTGARALARATLPSGPGAYVWFRQGVLVHLGRAVGKRGLRARIGGDALRGDADLSRSPFRAAVAAHLGIVEPDGGLPHLDPDEVASVDAWIDGCDVAWLRCATPAQASHLEATLRADHDPSLPTG